MLEHRSFFLTGLVAVGLVGSLGCQSTMTESAAREAEPKAPIASSELASEPPPAAPAKQYETVYFALDRSDLDEEARAALKSYAAQLQANPDGEAVTIEGHCDERGSDEYNIALGNRRASNVKRYLVDLGVPASRFETVSYGEDRPAMLGQGEDVWRLNRRSELRIGVRQASR